MLKSRYNPVCTKIIGPDIQGQGREGPGPYSHIDLYLATMNVLMSIGYKFLLLSLLGIYFAGVYFRFIQKCNHG